VERDRRWQTGAVLKGVQCEQVVCGKVELGGALVSGGVASGEGGEGLNRVEVSTTAGWADGPTTKGGNARVRAPKVAAVGAAGLEGDGPIEQKRVLAERFAEWLVHREGGENKVWVWVVPGAVGATRN
jgi:hypothetical protein